jgi:4-amino-4-deoxy-L-arabinose transferase-like glycosyltransferase
MIIVLRNYKHSHPILYEDIFLFSTSLMLGLVFCLLISPILFGSGIAILDPDGYGILGKQLYETGQFVSIQRGPLYPGLIAWISRLIGGYHVVAIQVFQCLLFSSSVVIVHHIFLKTIGKAARWAAWMTAIYPIMFWYTAKLWVETLLTFLLACITIVLISWIKKPSIKLSLLCGLLNGLAALCKGIMLFFGLWLPLVIFLLGLITKQATKIEVQPKKLLANYGIFVAGMLITTIPWTLRNYQLSGKIIPIHTGLGYNLYMGNGFTRYFFDSPFSYNQLWTKTQLDINYIYTKEASTQNLAITQDQVLLRASLQEFSAHPGFFIQKFFIDLLLLSYLAADIPKSILTGIAQIPFFFLALLGMWKAIKQKSSSLWLLAPISGLLIPVIFIFAFARLAAPIMPYMIGLTVYRLQSYYRRNYDQ